MVPDFEIHVGTGEDKGLMVRRVKEVKFYCIYSYVCNDDY